MKSLRTQGVRELETDTEPLIEAPARPGPELIVPPQVALHPPADPRPSEQQIREQLGVPPEAERVLILAESSHWDPNWLHTSEVYYDRFVERIIDKAIDYLEREPRRVWSLESVFFLRMYWEDRPEQQERIRALIDQRRLRLSSPAVSTADTIIPSTEALLRDFLMGQEWLRQHDLEQPSRLAYFPDSFGASPALPSLLRAAGFDHTTITRVDGMYFPGFELNLFGRYPLAGSTAEMLMKHERTLDFVWRDRSGAEVLTHWNAFSYFQGDLLAHRGLSRIYLFPLAVADRSERNIARRIRRYVHQLSPLSPTPYMFCPIGVDFIHPIRKLLPLLDRYNERRYPDTGVWVVNAGLDDYLSLIENYRSELPTIELDPNPYWSGFYTARPALKDRCHDLVDRILLAERLSALPENAAAAQELRNDLESARWTAAVSNHHDFITGTSPDPTVVDEQIPWLESARETADAAIRGMLNPAGTSLPLSGNGRPGDRRPLQRAGIPAWSRHGDALTVETDDYQVVLDAGAGGAIIHAQDRRSGENLLHGPSNDLISYRGSGGLWRMGNEFEGGTWKLHQRASRRRVDLQVDEYPEGLLVAWVSELGGERLRRSIRFTAGEPIIRFRVSGRAPRHRTVTVGFSTDLHAEQLVMDVPGGVVTRPGEKLRSPTFWPFQHFVHLHDPQHQHGLALYQRRPGAVTYNAQGGLQLIALRNAVKERAYRWFPVSGHPAGGFEPDPYTFDYALAFTAGGSWIDNALPTTAYALLQDGWAGPLNQQVSERTAGMLSLDRSDVWVTANKPASRGAGRVIRLYTHTAQGQPVTVRVHPGQLLQAAYLCDARERDLQQLEPSDGSVTLSMPGSIASLRLVI